MGNCKNCYTKIPDNQVFCAECAKIKEESATSENYLDGLLNSVAGVQEDNDQKAKRILERRRRKKEEQSKGMDIVPMNSNETKNENMEPDLVNQRIDSEESLADLGMEDIFSLKESDDEPIDTDKLDEFSNIGLIETPEEDNPLQEDMMEESSGELQMGMPRELETELQDVPDELPRELQMGIPRELETELQDVPDELPRELQMDVSEDLQQDAMEPLDLTELDMDLEENLMEEDINTEDLLSFIDSDNYKSNDEKEESETLPESNQEDTLSSEEIFSLDDLLGSMEEDMEIPFPDGQNFNEEIEMGEGADLGAIFSDALGAVSELEDFPEEADDASDLIAKVETINQEKKEKKKKEKKDKKSIFEKLFANIVDETEEKEEAKKEEEAAAKAQAKKEKKAKKKNVVGANGEEIEAVPREKGIKGLLQIFKKKKKDSEDQKGKKDATEKPKKKEKKEPEPEVEVYEGKINKRGAVLIFTFFGLLAVGILAGTDIFSYSQSIALADKKFQEKEYNVAFNEVSGLKVREKDIELVDKITTVMFVNKQLNSYNNFYSMKNYPEALDSLLKGLKRYDKYIDYAKKLKIESDLNYVRAQIIKELNNTFKLTEVEALDIIESKEQSEYSIKVHNTVAEKIPQPKDGTQ